ncbi:MAG: mechanosensitive ion channel family protein [Leptolyngbya sp.]|nr:mechanosensitive ion channel family protein [Leptolyngbya sp.]
MAGQRMIGFPIPQGLKYGLVGLLGLLFALGIGWGSPGQAQLGDVFLDFNLPTPAQGDGEQGDRIGSACVRLDGYCLFRVAAPASDLYPRVRDIERTLAKVRNAYVNAPDGDAIAVEVRQESPALDPDPAAPNLNPNLDGNPNSANPEGRTTPEIYLGVDPRQMVRLMSVTRFDATLKGVDLATTADILTEQVRLGLRQSRVERQPTYLLRQLGLSLGTLISIAGLTWGLNRWEKYLQRTKRQLQQSLRGLTPSFHDVLDERQQWNITEAQLRLAQLLQTALWVGGSLFVLGRFPYTRIIQVRVVDSLNIPLRLLPVVLGIYVAVRLSFALINRLAAALASNYEISVEGNRRMQLRVRTISRVTRGIVTILWLGIGGLIALTSVGVNIGPLLAGAGIIGVALSLPAQSLIKDAINGFFIILEDQYAVGDVITVHGIRGLVENINLRITQIRDEEGRLVTIPNSEIGVIANHSSHWSQADIYIPISYHSDVDQVLTLIETTGQAMKASDRWATPLLSEPEVLGVEDFGERGLTIRVWIKTQPLKQWEVAREYRRRLKVALDQAGIDIPAHIDFKAPSA